MQPIKTLLTAAAAVATVLASTTASAAIVCESFDSLPLGVTSNPLVTNPIVPNPADSTNFTFESPQQLEIVALKTSSHALAWGEGLAMDFSFEPFPPTFRPHQVVLSPATKTSSLTIEVYDIDGILAASQFISANSRVTYTSPWINNHIGFVYLFSDDVAHVEEVCGEW